VARGTITLSLDRADGRAAPAIAEAMTVLFGAGAGKVIVR
jgi:hypothetical protein